MGIQERPTSYAAAAGFLWEYAPLIIQMMQADPDSLRERIAEDHSNAAAWFVYGEGPDAEGNATGLYLVIGNAALARYIGSLDLPSIYDPIMLDFQFTISVEQMMVSHMVSIMSAIFARWKHRYFCIKSPAIADFLIALCVEEALEHLTHAEIDRERCRMWLQEARDGFFVFFPEDVLPASQTGWYQWITGDEAIEEYVAKGWAGQENDTPMIVQNIYLWGWEQLEALMKRQWPVPDPDMPF